MPARIQSVKVKKRFIEAVETLTKENYPKPRQAIISTLKMPSEHYYRLKDSRNSYPTLDQCYELCMKHSISAEWLITGRGGMYNENKITDPFIKIKNALHEIKTTKNIKQPSNKRK